MIKRFFVAIIHKKNLQLTAHLLIFESKTAFSLAKLKHLSFAFLTHKRIYFHRGCQKLINEKDCCYVHIFHVIIANHSYFSFIQ